MPMGRGTHLGPYEVLEPLGAGGMGESGRYVAAVTLDQTKLLLFDFSIRTWTELGRFKIVHNATWSRDERSVLRSRR